MTAIRTSLALLAAPLVLALAACGSADEEAEAALAGEPVAAVAPPAGTTWDEQVTRTEAGGWLVGNPEAPIKLVEYGSLTCPACATFSQEAAEPLHADYIDSGRVNFELRSVLIHGAADLLLTRLLECAAPEAAVPLAHQVWANLDTIQNQIAANAPALEQAQNLPEDERFFAMAERAGLVDWFAARGIPTDQARACLADSAAMQRLAEVTQTAAGENEVTGTPTFFVNGARVEGLDWSAVEAALQRAGAR